MHTYRNTLLALALLSSSMVLAQHPQGPPPDGRGGGHMGMGPGLHIGPQGMWWKNADVAAKLNLTPAQLQQMDGIFQAARPQLIDLKANVEKADAALAPLLDVNPPNQAAVLAQINVVAQARVALETTDARMLLGIRSVLTPQQWTALQALEQEHRQHGKGGPDGGWRGGRGSQNGGPNTPPPPPGQE